MLQFFLSSDSLIQTDLLLSETFLQHVVWLEETLSTNSVALEAANGIDDLPALIGAERQSQGRGQKNNRWWDCQGSLTFSLLINPLAQSIQQRQWPFLSLTTGLAVCRALQDFLPGEQVKLKWPNDVYVNGKKICGILLETVPKNPSRLVLGIGINVNNSLSEAPDELREIATSLIDVAGHPVDRTAVLIRVLRILEEELNALGMRDLQQIKRCRQHCYLTGHLISLKDITHEVTGMCLGLDDDGALRIMTETGPRKFFSGVITLIE